MSKTTNEKPAKENPYDAYFKQMDKDKNDAKVIYERLIKEDKNKNYIDILPPEFKDFKRSLIKRDILKAIDSAHECLNTCGLYNGRIFDKKEVVRYMMSITKNFFLAHCFVPRKNFMNDVIFRDREKKFDKLPVLEQRKLEEPYEELSSNLQWLKQCWEAYESRLNVKAGKMAVSYDKEEDGLPCTSRGNMCSVFTAVKGKWEKDKSGSLTLYNPRNKKKVTLTIDKYVKNEDVYICTDLAGKKVYLSSHESVSDAWDALFAVNKEIFSGWWNKTLIWK